MAYYVPPSEKVRGHVPTKLRPCIGHTRTNNGFFKLVEALL